jgi:hypothetical protein
MARRRNYAEEYRRRNELARQRGFRSYGAQRYHQKKTRVSYATRARVTAETIPATAVAERYSDIFGTLATKEMMMRAERMTPTERQWAMRASEEELRQAAREPGTPDKPNPFWYH